MVLNNSRVCTEMYACFDKTGRHVAIRTTQEECKNYLFWLLDSNDYEYLQNQFGVYIAKVIVTNKSRKHLKLIDRIINAKNRYDKNPKYFLSLSKFDKNIGEISQETLNKKELSDKQSTSTKHLLSGKFYVN